GSDPWEFWFGPAQADAHAEFLDTWDKIRYLPGMTPLDGAAEWARRYPLGLAEENGHSWSREYVRFISIAGWLQTSMGDLPIQLPVQDLAEILGVQKMTVSRYRKWAVADGFLVEVKAHSFHPDAKRNRATDFRFNVERFPILAERAQT